MRAGDWYGNKVFKFRRSGYDIGNGTILCADSGWQRNVRQMKSLIQEKGIIPMALMNVVQSEDIHVLVVDDEIFICDLLDEFLSRLGYHVDTATSGSEALTKLSEERYSTVLMDIKMPGMNGRELLRRIKEIDSTTGVIVLSAFGDSVTVSDMLQMGADDFLVKPFELQSLETLLHERHKSCCENAG